jgi:hypothetical protein
MKPVKKMPAKMPMKMGAMPMKGMPKGLSRMPKAMMPKAKKG